MKVRTMVVLALASTAASASNVIISPNMGMPVPVVGSEPGPDWANDINASLSIIDSHDHSSGHGVQVTPAGLNISSDLTFVDNNATNLRSARFYPQGSPISGGSDLGAIYESGVDLYYNDGNGNQIRITQGGSVTGATGTITGLPSGTASASFSAGIFSFQSATNTPAYMAVGPLILGTNTVSPHTVTLSPPNGLGANYALTLPSALPGSTSFLDVDTSGNMALVAATGSGNVVRATSPTIVSPTIDDSLDIVGAYASGAGVTLDLLNTSTAQEMYLQGGTVNSSPRLQVVSNDNFIIATNDTPHFQVGATGDTQNSGSHATGNGTHYDVVNLTTGQDLQLNSGSGNQSPSIATTTADNLALVANSTGSVVALAAGGAQTNGGNLTVNGGNLVVSGGSLTVSGSATLSGTGGNTPHACSRQSRAVNPASLVTVTCPAGEIVTGGGCYQTGGSGFLFWSYPDTDSSWTCNYSTSQVTTAWAICCSL